ncbi:MAG: sugar phosphate isomerase/epimerase [Chitinophagaceae bacterium]
MTTRKTFIRQSGLLMAGLTVKPDAFFKKTMPVGIQLYSLRNQIGKDLEAVVAKIAAAGYNDIETYGYNSSSDSFFGFSPKALKDLLKKHKLTSTSGHYAIDKFLLSDGSDDEVKKLIDVVKAAGQTYLTVSSFSHANTKTVADYAKVAKRFNAAGEICKKGGVQLGYHNHDSEFKMLDGASGYDVLLKETDGALLKMELDLFWAVRGGVDPVEMFKKYPGRFPLWHVKDMDKVNKTKNTEIGNGSIDFKSIFAAAKISGMKHFYMEQENFDIDPYESIARSSAYIKKTLLKA